MPEANFSFIPLLIVVALAFLVPVLEINILNEIKELEAINNIW